MSNIRKYYENKFREYPDVVDLLTFRQMMGGISDSFARLLIHEDIARLTVTTFRAGVHVFTASIEDLRKEPALFLPSKRA